MASYFKNLDLLKTHPLWAQLTDKQALFVTEFCTHGDKARAAKAAYNVLDDRAEKMAAKVLTIPKVAELVAKFFGYDPPPRQLTRKELLTILSSRIRAAKGDGKVLIQLIQMYTDLAGWDRGPKPATPAIKGPSKEDEINRLVQLAEQESSQEP